MTTFQVDAESIGLHEPVYLKCKIRADAELVLKCQRAGAKPYRGLPTGNLPPVWPHSSLKREIIEQSKMFLEHMRLKGYEPKHSEYQMELWGPYREKVDMRDAASPMINIEVGNPFFPDGRWVSAARASAPAQKGPMELSMELLDHRDMRRGVHFIVRGLFLAQSGKREESTGTLIV